jgi:hypothetical protein
MEKKTIGDYNKSVVEAIVLAHIEHGGNVWEGAMLDIPKRFFTIHPKALIEIEEIIGDTISKESKNGRKIL